MSITSTLPCNPSFLIGGRVRECRGARPCASCESNWCWAYTLRITCGCEDHALVVYEMSLCPHSKPHSVKRWLNQLCISDTDRATANVIPLYALQRRILPPGMRVKVLRIAVDVVIKTSVGNTWDGSGQPQIDSTRLAVWTCGCSLRRQTCLFKCYRIYGPNLVSVTVETCRPTSLPYPSPAFR